MSNISPRPEQSDDQEIALLTALDNLPTNAAYAIVKTGPTTLSQIAVGGVETDPLSLHLDQSTPQTVINGAPTFESGAHLDYENGYHLWFLNGVTDGYLSFNNSMFEFISPSATTYDVKAKSFITVDGTSSDFVKGDGSLDSNEYALDSALDDYALLDGSNQPFTGNLNISKADPEHRLTDTGNSEYTRVLKTDTNNFAYRYNRTGKVADPTYALSLDGNEYMNLATYRANFLLANGTINFWFKSSGSNGKIFWLGRHDFALDYFVVEIASTKLSWFIYNSNATKLRWTSTNAVNDNNWHMLTIRGGAGGNSIWLDGQALAGSYATGSSATTSFLSDINANPTRMAVGAGWVYNNVISYYTGLLDDMAVWNSKLTDAQVAYLYNSGTGRFFLLTDDTVGTDLLSLWRFDDGTGTTVTDSKSGYNGSFSGTVEGDEWEANGKISGMLTVGEFNVWSSRDGLTAGESAVTTFGDDEGRTILEGRTLRFNIGGTEQFQVDPSGDLVFPDDQYTYFGTGKDARIGYDGTNLNLKSNVVGSGAVNVLSDLVFVGAGTGLPYAEIYGDDVASDVTFTGTGVANKVQLTQFDTNGESNLATPDHTNDHITVVKTGIYKISYGIAADSSGAGARQIGFAVYINNGATQKANTHVHEDFAGGAGETQSITKTAIVSLTANDTVELWAWNETNTNAITINDLNLNIFQIGG